MDISYSMPQFHLETERYLASPKATSLAPLALVKRNQQFTGARVMAGISLPDEGSKYFRLRAIPQ